MKAILLLLVGVCAVNVFAEVRAPMPTASDETALAFRHSHRKVGGEMHNLSALFKWALVTGSGARPNPEWFCIYGKVFQIHEKGMLVRAYAGKSWTGDYRLVFLKNYPGQSKMVDGDRFVAIVTETGRQQYTTVAGGTATVEAYDYGALPTEEEVAELERARIERLAEIYRKIETNRAQLKVIEDAERQAQTSKVILYQLTQASNGLPSFQIEVAKRYLKGDGLPQDTALATHWLKSACTNHDSTASNLLSGIRR